jgi:hypothetical protein
MCMARRPAPSWASKVRVMMESNKPPRSSLLVKTLTDKELRKYAMQLAADAIVLARMTERAYARAEKKGSGKRKAIVAVGAVVVVVGLAKATKSLLSRD